MLAALVLLLGALPPVRALARPVLARPRCCFLRMSTSGFAPDENVITPSENVIIPDRLPSFGLSERESTRFDHMFRRDEPLLQEVFGMQMLFGMLGSRASGILGFVLGVGQIGPFFSFMPGRLGDASRTIGWYVFAAALTCANIASLWFRSARALWVAGSASLVSATLVLLLASRRLRLALDTALQRVQRVAGGGGAGTLTRWPAVGGTTKYHPHAGRRPPAPPREVWTPPPGWQARARDLRT